MRHQEPPKLIMIIYGPTPSVDWHCKLNDDEIICSGGRNLEELIYDTNVYPDTIMIWEGDLHVTPNKIGGVMEMLRKEYPYHPKPIILNGSHFHSKPHKWDTYLQGICDNVDERLSKIFK